jgi:hypothetical protein
MTQELDFDSRSQKIAELQAQVPPAQVVDFQTQPQQFFDLQILVPAAIKFSGLLRCVGRICSSDSRANGKLDSLRETD